MADEDADNGAQAQINVPDALQGGVYANGAMVWHSPYEFTLDFVTTQPPDPESPNVVQCVVTARVKIPPTVIFDLIKAINENMTKYESVFGEIPRIEAQEPEEDD
jgi:uncharacterized protein DUF3467